MTLRNESNIIKLLIFVQLFILTFCFLARSFCRGHWFLAPTQIALSITSSYCKTMEGGEDPLANAITADTLMAAVAASASASPASALPAPFPPAGQAADVEPETPPAEQLENSVLIMGYRVAFPEGKKPFPAQLAVMNKVLTALKTGQHALLESPTGSGKTLALLCSSLTFQKQFTLEMIANEKLRQEAQAKAKTKATATKGGANAEGSSGAVPAVGSGVNTARAIAIDDDDDDFALSQPSFAKFRYGRKQVKQSGEDASADIDNPDEAIAATRKRDAGELNANDVTGFAKTENKRKKRVLPMSFSAAVAAAEAEANNSTQHDDFHSVSAPSDNSKKRVAPPRIYFCSRTHSQLAQVVDELKNCPPSYLASPDPLNPVVSHLQTCVLGSKPNYCVNSRVNKQPAQVDEKCQQLLQENKCSFFKKLKKTNDLRRATPPVWDIEDMLALAKRHRECAYFRARDALDHANLVFCPYNYLLDPAIREAVGINLKNSIIVLDEAHNVEDTCRSSASCELTMDVLEAAIRAFTVVIKQGSRPPSYNALLKLLNGLDRWLRHVVKNAKELLQATGFEQESRVWPGAYTLAMLVEFCGVTKENFATLKQHVVSVAEHEKELSATGETSTGDDFQSPSKSGREDGPTILLGALAMNTVRSVINVADYMFRDELKYVDDFKLIVMRSRSLWNGRNNRRGYNNGNNGGGSSSGDGWQTKMCVWCLNAAVAFSDVIKEARSVILTSGTLSPMDSFAGELGTEFPVRLEANHVVNMRRQVFVGAVMNGPGFVDLSSTYKNQQEFRYQDSLGELLLQYARSIPGGILMFVPSYSLMDKLSSRWAQTGLLGKLEAIKTVFLEPRNAGKDFDALLDDYKNAIATTRLSLKQEQGSNPSAKTGAVFLAVYRGKVSEGIDFSNDNARAVLAVGIPYPSVKELQVLLKRKYQDEKSRVDKALVNGHVWYNLQAFRALNQALGRCIRHRMDYGAIILVDSRHRFQAHTRSLSKWMRPFIREFEHAEQCLPLFYEFFERNERELPLLASPSSAPLADAQASRDAASTGWIQAKRGAVTLKYEEDDQRRTPTQQQKPDQFGRSLASTMDSVRAYMAQQQQQEASRVFSIFEQKRTPRKQPGDDGSK